MTTKPSVELIRSRHDKAMDLADKADALRRAKKPRLAKAFYRQALVLERSCAMAFVNRKEYEPTRSIFFRSAASLAMLVGDKKECARLVAMGLDGNPPTEIADEMREILK